MSEINIRDLAQAYSELIDLDDDRQQLLQSAIERSIDAREIVGGQGASSKSKVTKLPNPLIAGGLAPAPSSPPKECPVLINGIVLCDPPNQPPSQPKPQHPPFFPIGKIARPTH
jgi:hypothetical protein